MDPSLLSIVSIVVVAGLIARLLMLHQGRRQAQAVHQKTRQRLERLSAEISALEKSAWQAEARAAKAEAALEAQAAHQEYGWLRSVYASSFMGIAHLDNNGSIIEANQGLRQILQLDAETLNGHPFLDLVVVEDQPQLADIFDGATIPQTFEVRLRLTDHQMCWCKLSISSIAEDQHTEGSLLVLVENIQDRKQLALALEARARELSRSNKELEQFALTASHDLNEPLDKIVAFGGLLKDECGGKLDEEGAEYLAYMISAAGRMQKLISSLFALAQVTVKARPFAPVDLNALMDDILVDYRLRIEETEAQITVEPLPTVYGDDVQLAQLLQNLVGNALKFHFPDKPPEIYISGKADVMIEDPEQPGVMRQMCRLSVKDKGIGFDALNNEKIFNAFQRLHPKGHYDGTGIGLAICRKIVERHNGYIFARSKPGHGATFRVVLPASAETT